MRSPRAWCVQGALLASVLAGLAVAPPLTAQQPPADSLRAAVAEAEARGDLPGLAEAHNALGAHMWGEARYPEALQAYGAARSVWTTLNDSTGLGRIHNNIGAVHYQWGNLGLALESYMRSLEVRQALGDRRGQALVLTNIGVVYRDWGQFERAQDVMGRAVALADASGVGQVRGYSRNNTGFLLLEMGNPTAAREAFQGSQAIYEDPANGFTPAEVRSGWTLNHHGLAMVHLREGDARSAVAMLEEVFGGDPLGATTGRLVWPLTDLAQAYQALGEPGRARALLEHALALSERATQRPRTVAVLGALSRLHESRGELAEALRYARRHSQVRESLLTEAGEQEIAALEFRADAERQRRENLELLEARRRQELLISRQRLGFVLGGALLLVSVALAGTLAHYNGRGRERERLLAASNAALEQANQELRDALSEVRTLEGFIPICARCKKVRDDQGFWESVESYVSSRSEALFTHSICSECGPELYGDFWEANAQGDDEMEGHRTSAGSEPEDLALNP